MELSPFSCFLLVVAGWLLTGTAWLAVDTSSGVQKRPSVHAKGLAGDVAGVVGGEEQHGRRDIQVRIAEASHGNGGDGRGHTLGIGALDFIRGVSPGRRG